MAKPCDGEECECSGRSWAIGRNGPYKEEPKGPLVVLWNNEQEGKIRLCRNCVGPVVWRLSLSDRRCHLCRVPMLDPLYGVRCEDHTYCTRCITLNTVIDNVGNIPTDDNDERDKAALKWVLQTHGPGRNKDEAVLKQLVDDAQIMHAKRKREKEVSKRREREQRIKRLSEWMPRFGQESPEQQERVLKKLKHSYDYQFGLTVSDFLVFCLDLGVPKKS